MTYTTIPKSEIPPPPPLTHKQYGEWMALCRTIRLADADRAFVIELGAMRMTSVISSLHRAARAAGVRVSTTFIGGCCYIVRTKVTKPLRQPPHAYTCKHCQYQGRTSNPGTKYCWQRECQKARRDANNQAMLARRRALPAPPKEGE